MQQPMIGISMNFMQLGSYHQFHVRDKYIDAVCESGAVPLPIPCLEDEDALQRYLELVGGLIIIGGLDYPPQLYGEAPHPKTEPAHPRRVKADYLLLELALKQGLPILGICAGMQLLNIFFGGRLIQHYEPLGNHYGEVFHPIRIAGGRWLQQIFAKDTITVNSNHHQTLAPGFLGKGLQVVAKAEDGVIEAVEYVAPQMVLGIQWHPERIPDPALRLPVFSFLNQQAQLTAQ